jgi:hypothetical protein
MSRSPPPGINHTAARSPHFDPANSCLGNVKQRLPHLILRSVIRIQESTQRVPVDSSSIARIGYAPEQRVLKLKEISKSSENSQCRLWTAF